MQTCDMNIQCNVLSMGVIGLNNDCERFDYSSNFFFSFDSEITRLKAGTITETR